MLIESPADETEKQFRAAMTELLLSIYRRMPDWLDFRIGRRFEFEGRYFREFQCSAGSVCAHIHSSAKQQGGFSRVIIERIGPPGDQQTWLVIRAGAETRIAGKELRAL